jgi:hypothetical protein
VLLDILKQPGIELLHTVLTALLGAQDRAVRGDAAEVVKALAVCPEEASDNEVALRMPQESGKLEQLVGAALTAAIAGCEECMRQPVPAFKKYKYDPENRWAKEVGVPCATTIKGVLTS